MKRPGSSDSLGALMPICPATEEQSPLGNHVYSREFQSMLDGLDEEGCLEASGHFTTEKKRRLSVEQVKVLEKIFEVENKLEPERKEKLAQELGLQPRQVAVWFQNRRARWKSKQLERDYGVLKANFDALKHNFEAHQQENEGLLKQIRVLKSKLSQENTDSKVSVNEDEALASESEHKIMEEPNAVASPVASLAGSEADCRSLKPNNTSGTSIFADFKDGLSDSDSSAILNEDNCPNAAAYNSPSRALQKQQHPMMSSSPTSSGFRFNGCCSSSSLSSTVNCLKFPEARDSGGWASAPHQRVYQAQSVKMEEHNLFSEEEACNFFSDEQAPSLHWYCSDEWT